MIKDTQASQASFTNGMIPSSRFIESCFVPEKFTRINRKVTQVAIAWASRKRCVRGLQISFPDAKVVRRYGKKNQLTAVVSRSYHRCHLHKNTHRKAQAKFGYTPAGLNAHDSVSACYNTEDTIRMGTSQMHYDRKLHH